jgi:hypothetical protein
MISNARTIAFLENKLYSCDRDYFVQNNLPTNWEDMTSEEAAQWEQNCLMGKGE